MLGIGLIIGVFLGANISLVLYACIIAGKQSERTELNERE